MQKTSFCHHSFVHLNEVIAILFCIVFFWLMSSFWALQNNDDRRLEDMLKSKREGMRIILEFFHMLILWFIICKIPINRCWKVKKKKKCWISQYFFPLSFQQKGVDFGESSQQISIPGVQPPHQTTDMTDLSHSQGVGVSRNHHASVFSRVRVYLLSYSCSSSTAVSSTALCWGSRMFSSSRSSSSSSLNVSRSS